MSLLTGRGYNDSSLNLLGRRAKTGGDEKVAGLMYRCLDEVLPLSHSTKNLRG